MRYAHPPVTTSVFMLDTCGGRLSQPGKRSAALMASCPRILQAAAIGSAMNLKHLTYPRALYRCRQSRESGVGSRESGIGNREKRVTLYCIGLEAPDS
jgi:hypothetical protein